MKKSLRPSRVNTKTKQTTTLNLSASPIWETDARSARAIHVSLGNHGWTLVSVRDKTPALASRRVSTYPASSDVVVIRGDGKGEHSC
jgi:hypothetical protein